MLLDNFDIQNQAAISTTSHKFSTQVTAFLTSHFKSDFTPVPPEGLKIKAIHNFGFVPSLDLRTLNDIMYHRR